MPGKLLLVDMEEGRVIPDAEIKERISHQQPYREWVEQNRITFHQRRAHAPGVGRACRTASCSICSIAFGYSSEDIEDILIPMIETHQEPVSSMGTDTPLAVFSDQPQRLFNYFKQTFAQVTNPPIDPIREELVMTLTELYRQRKQSALRNAGTLPHDPVQAPDLLQPGSRKAAQLG